MYVSKLAVGISVKNNFLKHDCLDIEILKIINGCKFSSVALISVSLSRHFYASVK